MMTKDCVRAFSEKMILLATMMIAWGFECKSQNVFLKTFGGNRDDEMHSMIRSHDGGFIMVGSTESFGQGNFGNSDDYIVKTDSEGNVIWSKTVGIQSYDDIYWIEPTNDSAYVICGIASDNDTSIGILLAKISESGNILWQKVLEQDHAGIGYCIRQTSDGGFIIAAEILMLDNLDFLLIKTDESGNVQWSKQMGSADPDIPSYIMQTHDGGYLACGVSRQNSATMPIYAVKTDSAGNIQWQKNYNTSPPFSRSTVSDIISTPDGGYIIAGGNTHNQLTSDIMLLKINSDGNVQWTKAYGGNEDEFCGSIIQNADGSFVVCGESASSESTGNFDGLVMLIDSSGDLIDSYLFGKTFADDDFVSIISLPDGGYMLGGTTSSFSQFFYGDFMMMKIDNEFNGPACVTLTPNIAETDFSLYASTDVSDSEVTISENDPIAVIDSGVNDSMVCDVATGEELLPPISDVINIYPNPSNGNCTISCKEATNSRIIVQLLNSAGQIINSFDKTVS
ncbi:MAG: hypothetical protein ACHQD9_04115, partial [Chitinophagales bacterium]